MRFTLRQNWAGPLLTGFFMGSDKFPGYDAAERGRVMNGWINFKDLLKVLLRAGLRLRFKHENGRWTRI